jgi:hypothetical protein
VFTVLLYALILMEFYPHCASIMYKRDGIVSSFDEAGARGYTIVGYAQNTVNMTLKGI